MIVIPTEVIWKWKQYGNNFTDVFPLSPLPLKMFFNLTANENSRGLAKLSNILAANNPVAGSWYQSNI